MCYFSLIFSRFTQFGIIIFTANGHSQFVFLLILPIASGY